MVYLWLPGWVRERSNLWYLSTFFFSRAARQGVRTTVLRLLLCVFAPVCVDLAEVAVLYVVLISHTQEK